LLMFDTTYLIGGTKKVFDSLSKTVGKECNSLGGMIK
jgi:hypothetical protein